LLSAEYTLPKHPSQNETRDAIPPSAPKKKERKKEKGMKQNKQI
jgi:hypothetical protein